MEVLFGKNLLGWEWSRRKSTRMWPMVKLSLGAHVSGINYCLLVVGLREAWEGQLWALSRPHSQQPWWVQQPRKGHRGGTPNSIYDDCLHIFLPKPFSLTEMQVNVYYEQSFPESYFMLFVLSLSSCCGLCLKTWWVYFPRKHPPRAHFTNNITLPNRVDSKRKNL